MVMSHDRIGGVLPVCSKVSHNGLSLISLWYLHTIIGRISVDPRYVAIHAVNRAVSFGGARYEGGNTLTNITHDFTLFERREQVGLQIRSRPPRKSAIQLIGAISVAKFQPLFDRSSPL